MHKVPVAFGGSFIFFKNDLRSANHYFRHFPVQPYFNQEKIAVPTTNIMIPKSR
jgi:hypothetical protein